MWWGEESIHRTVPPNNRECIESFYQSLLRWSLWAPDNKQNLLCYFYKVFMVFGLYSAVCNFVRLNRLWHIQFFKSTFHWGVTYHSERADSAPSNSKYAFIKHLPLALLTRLPVWGILHRQWSIIIKKIHTIRILFHDNTIKQPRSKKESKRVQLWKMITQLKKRMARNLFIFLL